jgi:hypothetical protein
MTFEQKFTEEEVEKQLTDNPKTAGVIAQSCGCALNTAKTLLQKLEAESRATRIMIEGCPTVGWMKGKLKGKPKGHL